jgi:hypothetical protein
MYLKETRFAEKTIDVNNIDFSFIRTSFFKNDSHFYLTIKMAFRVRSSSSFRPSESQQQYNSGVQLQHNSGSQQQYNSGVQQQLNSGSQCDY